MLAATRYGGKHTEELKTWHDTHDNCNYEGSTWGMESEAAEILWTQSVAAYTLHDHKAHRILRKGNS